MGILMERGGEKTKPIKANSKPIRQASRCRCGIAGLIKANFETNEWVGWGEIPQFIVY